MECRRLSLRLSVLGAGAGWVVAVGLMVLSTGLTSYSYELRGWALGLPSGQAVAHAMGVKPLKDTEILLGQGVDAPDKPLPNILSVSKDFAGQCPLWT